MPYSIYMEAKIETDEGEDVCSLSRAYNFDTLDMVEAVIEHFSKSASVLVDGADVGLDAGGSMDELTTPAPA